MFNQLIKTLNTSMDSIPIPMLDSIRQPKQSPSTQSSQQTTLDFQRTVETILRMISASLSEKLGEAVEEGQWRQLAGELLRSRGMQSQLVQVKERYNQLVNRSGGLMQQARKISSSIGEFITSINLFLESDELLVPLREIQKGINELSADRVEKQVSYLIRIFEHNFQEVIDGKVRKAENALLEQIALLKNLNKNLEGQLLAIKSNKNQDDSKVYELYLKINNLSDKITKMTVEKSQLERAIQAEQAVGEQWEKERAILEAEVGRLRLKEGELVDRVKAAESRVSRSQRSLKQQSSEAEGLNSVIERLKLKQEEIVEQLEAEAKKRESASETLRKKLQNQKFILEEQLEQHRQKYAELEVVLVQKEEEVGRLREEIRSMKERGDFQIDLQRDCKEEKVEEQPIPVDSQDTHPQPKAQQKISLNELMSRLNTLEAQKIELQGKLGTAQTVGVNKEVLKTLFLSYDDESKEWSVRRNIKQQIYSLLDLRDRLPKPQDPKASKWFGIF